MYERSETTKQDLLLLDLESPDEEPVVAVATDEAEYFGAFSPDGRWIAVASGQPDGDRLLVYPMGNSDPAAAITVFDPPGVVLGDLFWSSRGDELFFIADRGVHVIQVEDLESSVPRFSTPSLLIPGDFGLNTLSVTEDGERFLVVRPVERVPEVQLQVIVGWLGEVERKLSARQ